MFWVPTPPKYWTSPHVSSPAKPWVVAKVWTPIYAMHVKQLKNENVNILNKDAFFTSLYRLLAVEDQYFFAFEH